MGSYLNRLKCIQPDKNEIYAAVALGLPGLIMSDLFIPHGSRELAISIILCLFGGCCAVNAIADKRLSVIGQVFTVIWLQLLVITIAESLTQILNTGPRA